MNISQDKQPTINMGIDPRRQDIRLRNKSVNGQSYYAVKTIGAYCLPSCSSRLPKPENIDFYSINVKVEAAGFQPCKICKPVINFTIKKFALGYLLVAQSNKGICAVLMDNDSANLIADLQQRFSNTFLTNNKKLLDKVANQIIRLAEGKALSLNVKLDIQGTKFQKLVWNALRNIPVGTKVTYTYIANELGMPKAFRAVANACTVNPIAVIIPCHRVLRSNGALSGYRWGVERKQKLLQMEARLCQKYCKSNPLTHNMRL